MKYARKMQKQLTAEHVTFMLAGIIPMGAVFLESYTTMPFHVMIRFGKWDDILAEPVPTDEKVFPALIAHAHYARGVAYAAKGMVNQADEEYSKFQKAKVRRLWAPATSTHPPSGKPTRSYALAFCVPAHAQDVSRSLSAVLFVTRACA